MKMTDIIFQYLYELQLEDLKADPHYQAAREARRQAEENLMAELSPRQRSLLDSYIEQANYMDGLELRCLFSRCNLRTNLYRTTRANVENAFQDEIRVFKTAIPETVKVGDAISRGLTVMEYAPESKASIAYRAFAKELISYVEQSAPAQRSALHVLPGGGDRRVG